MENHGGRILPREIPDSPIELSGNPTSSLLVAKQVELAKGINFALRSMHPFHTSKGSLTCSTSLRQGALFPLR
jgi:hypothetical protein